MSEESPKTPPPEGASVHLLEHKWVLWYDSRKLQMASSDWFANLQRVSEMDTVESFWSTYNHVKRPTELEIGANYHFFKDGIKPMWEDPQNSAGGKWTLTLDLEGLDELWERLVLSLIGENLENEESVICGAVMARRKNGNRIHVWIKESANMEIVNQVRDTLKVTMKMEEGMGHFVFAPHSQ